MTTLLLTRPEEDSDASAESLIAAGYDVRTEPLLSIALLPEARFALLLTPLPRAIIATSRHALRAMADLHALHKIPLYVVGETSRAQAARFGFTDIRVADGTAATLLPRVKEDMPEGADLLYARGRDIKRDLEKELAAAGYLLRSVIVYGAEQASAFSPETRQALQAGTIDAVLFYSRRTAETYVTLVQAMDLNSHAGTALALSDDVASALAPLAWDRVHVAASPTQDALRDLIRTLFSH